MGLFDTFVNTIVGGGSSSNTPAASSAPASKASGGFGALLSSAIGGGGGGNTATPKPEANQNGGTDAVSNVGETVSSSDTRGRGNRSYLREAVQDRQNAKNNDVTWGNFQSKLQQAQDQYFKYFDTYQNTFGVRKDLTEDDQRRLDRAGITLYNSNEFGNGLEDWKTYGEGQERQIKAQTAQLRSFLDQNADKLNKDAADEVRAALDAMDRTSGEIWRTPYNNETLRARDAYKQTGNAYTVAEKAYNEAQAKLKDVMQNTATDQDYDKAVEAARQEAKAAEEALRLARNAYEEAGGLGHSYSNEDRVSDTIKGAMQNSAASSVDAFRALWEKGEGQRLANDQPRIAQLDLAARTAQTEYFRARAAAGGNEDDPAVKAAKQKYEEARDFANRYQGIVEGDQALAEKAAAKADDILEQSQLDIARAKEGASKLTQGLVDVGVAGTQLATDAAISAMTGIPSMALLGIRSFGGGTQQARLGGGNIDQQLAYGAANAAVEMMTEKMADGLAGMFGKGAADDVAEAVIGKLAQSDAGRTALRTIYGMMGEGAEEFISSAIDPALRSIYNGKSAKENYSEEEISDWLYDALIGAALALPGAGISTVTGQNAQKNAELRMADNMRMSGLGSVANQTDAAWNVLSGRYSPEQQANIERYAQNQLGIENPATQYTSAQQATPEQQAARQTVRTILESGRVNNTAANQILNNPALRAAAEYQTGLSFEGMTTEEARTALQRAARSGAYTTAQFNAQTERAATADNARAQAALEEEAVRNNASNYDSYIRGILRTGADTQTANEILNDPTLKEVWERMTGKTLPENRKSAVKMLRETTRSNVDINVDSAIEQYIAERNAPPQTAENAPQTQDVSAGEITQAETQTEATGEPQELNFNPTPTAETQTAETATAPTEGAPAEAAQLTAPAPAPAAQTQTGNITLTPTETTTAESTNGRGRERERGGSQNIRTNENAEQPLRQEFENIPDTYRQLTNKETQAAADEILAKGFDSALTEVTEAIGRAKAGMKLSPAHFVAGFQVANELTRRGNVQQAREIMSDLIAEQTAAGQLGQVGRLVRQAISDSDPATRMMAMQKLIGKLNQQLTKGQTRTNVVRGVGSETGKIQVSEQLLSDYANAKPGGEQQAAYDAIKKEIASQIPPTFSDKFTALRYLNMLGNFKTQARNLIGNTAMMLATNIKYTTQASIEALSSALSGGNYQRNTTLFANRDLLRQANDVFMNNMDDISGDGKYSEPTKQMSKDIRDEQRIFGTAVAPEWTGAIGRGAANAYNKTLGSALEKYRLATKWAMESGDTLFMRPVFNRAYAGWMKAHGVTDISTATAEQKASAYDFAKKEAQEATFHDSNVVSDAVARFARGQNTPRWWSALCEGVIPFRKTPANVGVRAFEYSPLGVTKVIYDAFNVKNGKKSGADIINDLSKTVTGSALFAAGMLLKAMGHARASGAEDDDELNYFQKQQGAMDYSINVNGTNISMSNLAPMSIPFFMGVKLQEYREESGMPSSMQEIGEIASVLAEPMLEMSMLSGVNDFFNNLASVGDGNSSIMSLVGNAALGYLSQGLTNTLLGQLEQANEENRQTTYVDTQSADATALDQFLSPAAQRKLAGYGAKTPGVDYHQEDYVDAWGRTQSNGGTAARYLNALLNPTYLSGDRSTEVDAELERLHSDNADVEGFPEVLPQKRSRNAVIGDGIVMTPDEYHQFSIESGQKKLELVSDFMNSRQYRDMSDAERAKTIQDLYTFAEEQSLQKVRSSYGVEKKSQWETEAGLRNPEEYIAAKNIFGADEPDYSNMDDVFRNWGSYSSDTQGALKKLSGVNNMRFAYDELGMGTERYNKDKTRITKYETEGLESEEKAAADALIISKHFKDYSDADKLKTLEAQNPPTNKQTGKRAAIVRRYDAAMNVYDIPFDTWTKVEAYLQDAGSTSTKTLYKAADYAGIPSWQARWVYYKDSGNEKEIDVYNDFFPQDYVAKEKPSYLDYLEEAATEQAPTQNQGAGSFLAGLLG